MTGDHVNLEIGEAVLAVLAIILGAFFTSLFLVVRKKRDIRRLIIRYIEAIIFIAPASVILLLGEESIQEALLYSYNNVGIFSVGVPFILYTFGFAVIAIMVYEVVNALEEEDESESDIPEKGNETRKPKPKQNPQKGSRKK